MIRDMAVMMGGQLGASIADQIVTTEFQQIAQGIQTDQTNMNIATKTFIQNLQLAQRNQLKNMVNLFGSAQQQVNTLMTNQTTTMQQMQSYLTSMISLQTPAQYYLTQPINYDQQFTNATMYTPVGPAWKNIYQIGNWQFDETTNSFWQMQHVPITTTPQNTAFENSIFTEWITRQSYEIVCNITIYQISYPFYVGIIFNKARWISGDSYGIQKYRTLGIFGLNQNTVNAYFAQQTSSSQKTSSTTQVPSQPVYPLQQIFNNQGKLPIAINTSTIQNIAVQPLIVHIKIKPAPTTVQYKMWFASSKEPQAYNTITTGSTASKSLKLTATAKTSTGKTYAYNLANNNDIFLYHGIGFLSAGAIAQFSIQSPQSLVFSTNNVQLFTTEINNYITQQQALLKTQQINSGILPNSGATS